tara:strand:+ start:137 stop:451 length:315 start_codon:yes stop_codon:yes gene_type:complete
MNSVDKLNNNCIGCGVDMGSQNPRQYCKKTFCPVEYPSSEDEINFINLKNKKLSKKNPWICGECTITNYTEKCILCDYTRQKSNNLTQKISYALASTARANSKV